MIDLLYLTFNAGKAEISPAVFAYHLQSTFDHALPELVVFSLQEMCPLEHAYLGPYFLNTYLKCYESALNLAAAKFTSEREGRNAPKDKPYTLVKVSNVGMTGIMLFSLDPAALCCIQDAEVGFGAGDMANKGAVGLRVMYAKQVNGEMKETELTFVSTHLAAMEWNLERRNKNWQSIVSGLLFANPQKIVDNGPNHIVRDGVEQPLLTDRSSTDTLFHEATERALHDISIYKPGTQLFVAGDLNYRLSKTSPPSNARFPSLDSASEDYYPRFLEFDQLAKEKEAGRTLHGLSEAKITFPPTYKYDVKSKVKTSQAPEPAEELEQIAEEEEEDPGKDEVEWEFATHRWPGWCDRVLYLDTPDWARGPKIKVTKYDCLPVVRSSDHRAVYLRAQVPILSPAELKPSKEVVERGRNDPSGRRDPRLKLPFGIDVDSWEHRATVKKWEYVIGWSLLISKNKKFIYGVASFTLFALGVYWYRAGILAS